MLIVCANGNAQAYGPLVEGALAVIGQPCLRTMQKENHDEKGSLDENQNDTVS